MADESQIDQLFQSALADIRAGRTADARHKLIEVVQADQFHEHAWYWLSTVVDTDKERLICLDNVLTINPQHELALRRLEEIRPTPSDESDLVETPVPAVETPSDENWRAPLRNAQPLTDEQIDELAQKEPPDHDFRDLYWAWLSSMIMRRNTAYTKELENSDVRHIGLNLLVIVGCNVVFVVVLAVMLVALNGGLQPVVEPAALALEEIGAMDTSFLIPVPFRSAVEAANVMWGAFSARPFDRLFTLIGVQGQALRELTGTVEQWLTVLLISYAIITFFATIIWQIFRSIVNNQVATWLMRGRGDAIQTTHALTTGLTAASIVRIPIAFIIPFMPIQATLWILGVWVIYRLILESGAIGSVHKFNLLVGVVTIFISSILVMSISSLLMSAIIS